MRYKLTTIWKIGKALVVMTASGVAVMVFDLNRLAYYVTIFTLLLYLKSQFNKIFKHNS